MLLLLFQLSCVSLPSEVDSRYVGTCLVLEKSFFLLQTRESLYKSTRLLSSNSSHGKYSKVIDILAEGTHAEIYKILAAADGSWGNFLRVQVKILDGKYSGIIADVPVHAPYHPSPKWTKNFTLDPNAIEFNEDIVKPCE